MMTVNKCFFPIQLLIIHAYFFTLKSGWPSSKGFTPIDCETFVISLTDPVIFFLFCPRREEFLALFSSLSIVIILFSDCDVQFISQIFSFIIENAKESVDFICLPKLAFLVWQILPTHWYPMNFELLP